MANGKIKVRVVRPVEGKKIGDEFQCFPHEYKLQIKHKSLEVIGEDEGGSSNAKLTVEQLKEALKEKAVDIPEGAKKADLVALLDKAQAEGNE